MEEYSISSSGSAGSLQDFTDAFSFVDFSVFTLFSFTCATDIDHYSRLRLITGSTAAVLVLLTLLYAALRSSRVGPKLYSAGLLLCFLVYPSLVTVTIQALAPCDEFDNGRSYLRADYRINCDCDGAGVFGEGACSTNRYDAMVLWAAVCVVLFCVSIPAFYLVVLVANRRKLYPRNRNRVMAVWRASGSTTASVVVHEPAHMAPAAEAHLQHSMELAAVTLSTCASAKGRCCCCCGGGGSFTPTKSSSLPYSPDRSQTVRYRRVSGTPPGFTKPDVPSYPPPDGTAAPFYFEFSPVVNRKQVRRLDDVVDAWHGAALYNGDADLDARDEDESIGKFEFLFADYRAQYFWFEVAQMMLKFLCVCVWGGGVVRRWC